MNDTEAGAPPARAASLPILALMWVIVSGQLALSIYLPSIVAMTEEFGDRAGVQMAMTAYLVSFGLCQLVVGPLSDRFGRRPVLIVGLVLHALAAAISALAPSLTVLILARVLQGAGSCTGAVLTRAIVRDVATRETAARLLSYMSTAFALAPAIGPLIGGQIHVWFGWRGSFALLALMGFAGLVAVTLRLQETRAATPAGQGEIRTRAAFAMVLFNRQFLALSMAVGSTAATFFAFISAGPVVLIGLLGVRPETFGLFTFAWASAFILATVFGMRFLAGVDPLRIMGAGILLSAAGALIMVAAGLTIGAHVATVAIPFAMIGFANGLIVPNGFALAMSSIPAAVGGTASAILGFQQVAIGIVISAIMGVLTHDTELPMGITMTAAGVFGLAALAFVRRS